MSLPIFYSDAPLHDDYLSLNEETSKHIVQVLRMNAGELIQLTDGKGNLLTARIENAHKKHSAVLVTQRMFQPKKEKQVSIAISLLKNTTRFEWFLEKATEVGVTDIVPLICKRTEREKFRFARMQQILIASMMQSQQTWLPHLHQPIVFEQALSSSTYTTKLIAHCEDQQKFQLHDFRDALSVQIFIGPEGDFTNEEIAMALSADVKPVALGNTRLRAETAGVVAASLLCI